MEHNVERWLKERGYGTVSDGNGLSVTDGKGASYALDTTGFTADGGTYKGTDSAIRTALGKSGASGPAGYTPLRNTLAAAGATVGYDAVADAPIVNGQMLNTNDSRLVKVGDDYWIEKGFAKNFTPEPYENPYKKKISSLLSELTDMEFFYDPANDSALQAAQEQAMLAAKQSANARGLLGGSTAEIMRQRAAQELVPEYEQMAYARYADTRDARMDTLTLLGTLTENAFAEYLGKENLVLDTHRFAQEAQSAADTRAHRAQEEALERDRLGQEKMLKQEELAQEKILGEAELAQENALAREEIKLSREELAQEKEISDAQLAQKREAETFANQLDKVIVMGTVDEEASGVLGLPVGALTAEQMQFLMNLQMTSGFHAWAALAGNLTQASGSTATGG